MTHAGFDTGAFPGPGITSWIINNTNLEWIGFYFPTPAHQWAYPNHQETSWMPPTAPDSVRTLLVGQGWGLAPIYAGQQAGFTSLNNPQQGILDAQDAAAMATACGFPANSVIFLDIEQPPQGLPQNLIDYYTAWVQELFNQNFYPGIYTSASVMTSFINADRRPAVWVAAWQGNRFLDCSQGSPQSPYPTPNPMDSGIQTAFEWQHTNGCTIQTPLGTVNPVDFDSSINADPSIFLTP